jgi:hypothetical protein
MPRTETTTRTLYRFDELSEDAQQKAIDKLRDLNVDFDWWDGCYEMLVEDFKAIGISVDKKQPFYFNIHREGEFQLNSPWVSDTLALLTAAGIENAAELAPNIGIGIETRHHGGGSTSHHAEIENHGDDSEGIDIAEIATALTEFLRGKQHDALTLLQTEMEYLMSDEAIRETIEANEYEFTAGGDLA